MRLWIRSAVSAALALAFGACAEPGPVAPPLVASPLLATAAALPSVRISEIHYDNAGTDVGEAIEVSAPAGTDLTGWSLVLYNGNGGAKYTPTFTFSGVVADLCSGRGVAVATYASNGVQNGSPDGVALVDASGALVEFLSYEGSFAATNGVAVGVTSTDIGVSETGAEPVGQSLQRQSDGSWATPATSTFGSCNDNGAPPPPPVVASVSVTPNVVPLLIGGTQQLTAVAVDANGTPITTATFTWTSSDAGVATVSTTGLVSAVASGTANVIATEASGKADTVAITVAAAPPPLPATRFSEIHYDNAGTDLGEAIEVEGPAGTDLTGWSIVLYNGNGGALYNTTPLAGTIPDLCTGRGVIAVPIAGIQNGNPDGFALVNASGSVVEFLSYGGTFVAVGGAANGMLSTDLGVSETTTTPAGQSLHRDNSGIWQAAATASFGACYGQTPPPPSNAITFTGRVSADPALPVGFEDQLFATLRDPQGVVVPTTFTWVSETPAVATIDANGVVHAVSVGTFTVRATAADGTTATYSLSAQVATAGGTAQYGNNVEFGIPADGDVSDDILVARAEFTTSFNPLRGIPNWVSYNLEATHIGSQDRCDCFTYDPALPAALPRYTTADYTGAGTFAGYGIDRGHLARSFDRSTGLLDNASTFYFSNIIPQAADNNQGPWAQLENFLGDEARVNNKEVFIIAGASGSKGTVKGEGKITIPAYTWKVAVTMPRDQGLQQVQRASDLTVTAYVLPNDAGIRNVPWQSYEVTVDSVEALSGYDVLALLPDAIEIAVESKTKPPVAAIDGPYSSAEGASVAMSGAASTDPDGDALTYAWSFGDGAVGTGASTTHVYRQDGSFTVQLVVTDARGLADTVSTTATIANVSPVIAVFPGATLYPFETYKANGTFTDPGTDPWTATVDYGLGGGSQALSLAGRTFVLSQVYSQAGTFTVRVAVSDDDATHTRTARVTVLTVSDGILGTQASLQLLRSAGRISNAVFQSLDAQLSAARTALAAGQIRPTMTILDNVQAAIRRYEASGEISKADSAALRSVITRLITSLNKS